MNATTNNKDARFVYVPLGDYYLAVNKEAAAAGARISKMRIRLGDMVVIRSMGYTSRLTDGQEIGKVDVKV